MEKYTEENFENLSISQPNHNEQGSIKLDLVEVGKCVI